MCLVSLVEEISGPQLTREKFYMDSGEIPFLGALKTLIIELLA